MLILSTLTIMAIVYTQKVEGANHSFNEDFNLNFDNETCRGKTKWHLINDYNTNFTLTNPDHENQIIPVNSSCALLFGRDLLPDSFIQKNAYLLITSSDYGLKVTVFDESNIAIKNYDYSRSSETLTSEENAIKILVNKTIIGYYHFNESGPNIEILKENNDNELLKTAERVQYEEKLWDSVGIDKSEYVFSYYLPKNYENDLTGEGSGDNNGDNDNTVIPPGNITDDSNFWKPWTITLVAVGSFVVISIICVSAYHIGKRRSQEENANIIEDLDPVDFRIPRIHNIYSGFSDRFRGNDY